MGKKTEGVTLFKKYINQPTKKDRRLDAHDKAFQQLKDQSDPVKGPKKSIKF